MPTITPDDGPADRPPFLAEALAVWSERTPNVNAPVAELAAWFELKVELLQPITTDPEHPEHADACEFARNAATVAKSLRDKEISDE